MIIKINNLLRKNILREKRFADLVNVFIIILLVLGSFFLYFLSYICFRRSISIKRGNLFFLKNQTGNVDLDWFSIRLTDRLINNFSIYDSLSIVSRYDLNGFYQEIETFPGQSELKKSQLILFNEVFGSEFIFFGSFFYSSPTKINLALKKYDASSGQITAFRDFF